MLFFLVCLLLCCNIFNLTGKPITLIIITSSGSVILMTTVAEIRQGQILNSVNQTKQPSYIQLLLRYTGWNSVSQTCLWVLLFFQTWSKLYVQLDCAVHFAKVPSQKFCEKQACFIWHFSWLWWTRGQLWFFSAIQKSQSVYKHLLNPLASNNFIWYLHM